MLCLPAQRGRTTPLCTRACVAMSGAFGYELDLSVLSPEEREEIRGQIAQFREDEALLQRGLYFRLDEYTQEQDAAAWMLCSVDRSRALVNVVLTAAHVNAPLIHIKLKGLAPEGRYRILENGQTHSGAALLYAGYTLPQLSGDYPIFRLHLERVLPGEE